MTKPIYTGAEWTHGTIDQLWQAIDHVAKTKYGLEYDQPQIEIVSAQQMVQLTATHGLPVVYPHWSFGKQHIIKDKKHRQGDTHAALEMIINTSPPITYLCEQNSATIQAMVLAHAVCGHASMFKNNYMFKRYGDPKSILSYMRYARKYVMECEKKYGQDKVEKIIDAANSLSMWSIDKYPRRRVNEKEKKQREEVWKAYQEESFDLVFDRTITRHTKAFKQRVESGFKWKFPEENLLYFIEKNSPILEGWQREILRIVRKHFEWVYPVLKTKLIHEGWSNFWEHVILTDLYDDGLLDEGAYLEFLHWHTAVNNQGAYHYRLQPYALGGAIFKDIRRICENPTPEDFENYPRIAGKEWIPIFKDIAENYNDEDLIRQYLTPTVIKELQLMTIGDDTADEFTTVLYTTDGDDLTGIRKALAKQHSTTHMYPLVEVTGYDIKKDRGLYLTHTIVDDILLDKEEAQKTLKYVHKLWGYPVTLESKKQDGAVVQTIQRAFK